MREVKQYRQGDVLIETIEAIPVRQPYIHERLLVRGEGRYHGHYIEGEVDIFENNHFSIKDTTCHYIKLKSKGELVHRHTETKEKTGDHKTIELPPGTYRIIRQREYNPYLKAIELLHD